MTQNQIAYRANLERERANRAQEALQAAKLREERRQFNWSNWHQAISNVGKGLGSIIKFF